MAKKSPFVPKLDNSVKGVTLKWSRMVPESEFCFSFVQGMCDRMGISYFKYDKVALAYPNKISALKSLQQRIEKYQKTKNTEFLIDAANFAMIEFMHPSIKGAHFTPTDNNASPGRTKVDDVITNKGNLDIF